MPFHQGIPEALLGCLLLSSEQSPNPRLFSPYTHSTEQRLSRKRKMTITTNPTPLNPSLRTKEVKRNTHQFS
jgi:hypothetical protein